MRARIAVHPEKPENKGRQMSGNQVHPRIHLIDLEPGGIRNFAASYIVKGEKTAIVETGPKASAPNLLRHIRANHVNPADVAYITVSHIHLDHGGGAGTLMKEFPHAELIVHRRGKPHLADPDLLWTRSQEALKETAHLYGEPEPIPEERITAAGDGLILSLGEGVELKVLETVGHASHHLSFFETSSRSLFPGDAAGIYLNELDVTVPTTPAPFRLDLALASLKRLIDLRPSAVYYSHFGNPQDPLVKLKGYEEQLQLWAECAEEGLKEGEGLEAVRRRILARDLMFSKAESYVRKHPIFRETVMYNSVEGVTEYVRNQLASQ